MSGTDDPFKNIAGLNGADPVGSEEDAKPVPLPEVPEEVSQLLNSLSNKQLGEFVRLRDEVESTIRAENPMLIESELKKELEARIAPIVQKWLEES